MSKDKFVKTYSVLYSQIYFEEEGNIPVFTYPTSCVVKGCMTTTLKHMNEKWYENLNREGKIHYACPKYDFSD